MSRLKRLNTRVVCVVLTLAALATVLTVAVPTSVDAGGCGTEYHYFSDASRTTEVGVRGRMPSQCECVFYGWGIITSYSKAQAAPCF